MIKPSYRTCTVLETKENKEKYKKRFVTVARWEKWGPRSGWHIRKFKALFFFFISPAYECDRILMYIPFFVQGAFYVNKHWVCLNHRIEISKFPKQYMKNANIDISLPKFFISNCTVYPFPA